MTQLVEVSEKGKIFTLNFSKVKGHSEDDPNLKFYGILAQKYIGGILEEEANSGMITEDENLADSLIAALSENAVTPLVLYEVLDEMLS